MKFVIENLEHRLPKWCFLEYEHISQIVGKKNLVFTNVKGGISKKLSKLGAVSIKPASEFIPADAKVCVLDMEAEKTLEPEDSKNFDYFVFGGILGDEPPTGKTKLVYGKDFEKTMNWRKRDLGKKQMSTDTAVNVAKKILEGIELKNLNFADNVEIEIKKGESVILPFRYLLDSSGDFVIYPKLLEYIKKRRGF